MEMYLYDAYLVTVLLHGEPYATCVVFRSCCVVPSTKS